MHYGKNLFMKASLTCLLLLASVMNSHAAIVVGGSSLLTETFLSQLENQLGEGPIALTNIFTKSTGLTAADFHTAADGQGRTIVVLQATNDDNSQSAVVGGYNPQSWNNTTGFNTVNSDPANRTAFLFNLTLSQFLLQKTNSRGDYQTYSSTSDGPSFGISDLRVDFSLNTGSSYLDSYGPSLANGASVIDGISGAFDGNSNITISALEVFKISQVPIPSAVWLFVSALLGFLGLKRRTQ